MKFSFVHFWCSVKFSLFFRVARGFYGIKYSCPVLVFSNFVSFRCFSERPDKLKQMVSKLSSEDLLDHPLIKTLYLEIEKYKDQIWEKEEEMESLNALLTEAQGRS